MLKGCQPERALGMQANYMLAVPTVGTFCTRLGVSSALTGVIVGASDFASMFATPGAASLVLLLRVLLCQALPHMAPLHMGDA